MIGTEYNWLVSPTRSETGLVRVRLAGSGMLTLVVAILCASVVIVGGRASIVRLASPATLSIRP